MNFLILTQYFPPEIGAAPTRLNALARELIKMGHRVEVVTGMPNYPHGKISPEYKGSSYRRECREGIVIHRVWLYPTVGSGVGRILNYLSFSLFAIYALFQTAKPDYLFVESPPPTLSFPAFLYSRVRGVPFILNVADLWPDTLVEMGLLNKGIAFRILRWLERWSYKKAMYVNAVTEGLRSSLLHQKGLPVDKIMFLPNGVDTDRNRPGQPNTRLKDSLGLTDKKVILYSGTLGRAHGLEHVLEAAGMLRLETDIHFLFLGDGSERPMLEKLKSQLSLENVSFHDAVSLDELPSFQSIAHCGLVSLRNLPIFDGARPSKMFPMLSAGKPLIFCGNGEGARLVKLANAGIVLPPEDPQALATAVPQLLRNSALLKEFGENGRRFVQENHEWSKLIGDWLQGLQDAPPSLISFPNRSDQPALEQ